MPTITNPLSRYHKYKLKRVNNFSNASLTLEQIKLAQDDIVAFGELVCEKQAFPHHRRWIEALIGQSNELLQYIAGEDTNILSPRNSAKSTWLAIILSWIIAKNPGIQIIYQSYSEPVAASRSRVIKRIIESPRYQIVFPHIKKSSRWSDLDWEIDKSAAGVTDVASNFTLFATGAIGSIVSRRSCLVVLDDLIKSSKSIENREIREQIVKSFYETTYPTLNPGGRCISIGTRFRRDDIHATEFIASKGWKVLEQRAILKDKTGKESSYWEDRFSLAFLQELRDKDPLTFSYQYQNVIAETGSEAISHDWIHRADIPFVHEFDRIICGCDLANSLKTRADYTCFVLGGKKGDCYYIIDVRYGRWNGNLEKFEIVRSLRDDWKGFDLLFEKVAYQTSFRGDFDIWADDAGLHDVYCRGVYLPGDKYQRLSGFKGLFQRGKVFFNRYRDMGRLINEIVNFGEEEYDDGADAFILCMAGLTGRRRLDVGEVD